MLLIRTTKPGRSSSRYARITHSASSASKDAVVLTACVSDTFTLPPHLRCRQPAEPPRSGCAGITPTTAQPLYHRGGRSPPRERPVARPPRKPNNLLPVV